VTSSAHGTDGAWGTTATAPAVIPPVQLRTLVLRRLLRHRLAVVSLVFLFLLIVVAVLAPVVAPIGPYRIDFRHVLTPPDSTFILGTDTAGRDVWARLVYGARVSLTVGFAAVLISQTVGISLGMIAGHYGGWLDQVLMRATDAIMCFPSLVLMIVVAAAFGAGLSRTILVIGFISWPPVARLVRGQILGLRESEYVTASRVVGVGDRSIMVRHLFPNVVPYVVVAATFGVAYAILDEAALSFLGLGVPVPEPSWGNMLSDAQSISVMTMAPWFWIPPGIMISATVLAITFIGDGLRDALDPRTLVK